MSGSLAFFGAFNPPTKAHLALAEFALTQTGADRVIFVPSRSAYIRGDQGKDFAYGDGERMNMLKTAAAARAWMTVSDWELKCPTQPRTYETLCHFREHGVTPSLLMGSDKLAELETGWRHVHEIAAEFGIVCLTRGGDDVEGLLQQDPFLKKLAPYIRLLKTPEDTRFVSSSAVRERVARMRQLREELKALVPGEILPLLMCDHD